MARRNALLALALVVAVFALGLWIGHWFPKVVLPWEIVKGCVRMPAEALCYSEPAWRVWWERHFVFYAPFLCPAALLAVVFYLLWRAATWLDNR